MAKRKGPTHTEAHAGLADGTVESRELIAAGGRSRMGRSTVVIVCPFCRSHVEAFIWSLAGGGKRCDCGALFGSLGNGYHWATPEPTDSTNGAA